VAGFGTAAPHTFAPHTPPPPPPNPQIGNATLKFVATSDSGDGAASDALEVTLPVLGRQGPVFIATSFAIRPNASRWALGESAW
jgi:hypothetical protein